MDRAKFEHIIIGPICCFERIRWGHGMVGWNGWFPWQLSRKQLYIGKNNLRDSKWAHRLSISTYRFNRRVYHREIFDHYGKDMLWKLNSWIDSFVLFFFNLIFCTCLAEHSSNNHYPSTKSNLPVRGILPWSEWLRKILSLCGKRKWMGHLQFWMRSWNCFRSIYQQLQFPL